MKKTSLALIVLLAGYLTANAQFTLERTGLVNTDKPEQDYIVLEFEGKTQQELYQAVNVYLHSLYVNPQHVLSTMENQAITVNGISEDAIDISLKKKPILYDIKYTISIAFKDDRIRINTPHIIEMSIWSLSNTKYEFHVEGLGYPFYNGVYNKRGEVMNETAKKSIPDFFNRYVAKLVAAVNEDSGSNINDW